VLERFCGSLKRADSLLQFLCLSCDRYGGWHGSRNLPRAIAEHTKALDCLAIEVDQYSFHQEKITMFIPSLKVCQFTLDEVAVVGNGDIEVGGAGIYIEAIKGNLWFREKTLMANFPHDTEWRERKEASLAWCVEQNAKLLDIGEARPQIIVERPVPTSGLQPNCFLLPLQLAGALAHRREQQYCTTTVP